VNAGDEYVNGAAPAWADGPPAGFDDEPSRENNDRAEDPTELPPHDASAEKRLLGLCILEDGALDKALEILKPEDFFVEGHRRIFEVLAALRADGLSVEIELLGSRLKDAGRIMQVGSMGYLAELVAQSALPSNLQAYAKIIAEKARLRGIVFACQAGAAKARLGADSGELIATTTALLAEVTPSDASTGLASRVSTVETSWLTDAPPPREYLARDVRTGLGALMSNGVALLVAAGGLGKSFATLSAVVAVATGGRWFGTLQVERPGRVLIVSGEDDAVEIRRRIYYVARAVGVTEIPADAVDVLDMHDVYAPLLDKDGNRTEHADALVKLIKARGPFALVVMDPAVQFAGSANIDKDNAHACALIALFAAIATAATGLVLGVHHTSLTARRSGTIDATAIRGATSLGDSARMVLLLHATTLEHADKDTQQRLGQVAALACVKTNYSKAWEPIELRRGEQGELLPLDDIDRSLLAETRRSADPKTARKVERKAEDDAREAVEDAAVVQAVSESHPEPIPLRDLCKRVQAIAHCGDLRAGVAIARAPRDRIGVRTGPRNAKLHFLIGDVPQ
jgi:hypothetical protein